LGEPDEVLVADARGGLTPAQMVDQKLLALTRGGNSGLYTQAAGRPQDLRRISGARKALTSLPGRLKPRRSEGGGAGPFPPGALPMSSDPESPEAGAD
jgi:hypothetical protein